jgi:hypothetical protein
MPVSSTSVPFAVAKKWAQRLHRALAPTAASLTLSDCQQGVARMLGHPHWHALAQGQLPSPAVVLPALPEGEGVNEWLRLAFEGMSELDLVLVSPHPVEIHGVYHGQRAKVGEISFNEVDRRVRVLLDVLLDSAHTGQANWRSDRPLHTEGWITTPAGEVHVRADALPCVVQGQPGSRLALRLSPKGVLATLSPLKDAQGQALDVAGLARQSEGLLLIAGKPRCGRTSTLATLARQATEATEGGPAPFARPFVIDARGELQALGVNVPSVPWVDDLAHPRVHALRQALAAGVDLVVMDTLETAEEVDVLIEALAQGVRVMACFTAVTPEAVTTRLKALGGAVLSPDIVFQERPAPHYAVTARHGVTTP